MFLNDDNWKDDSNPTVKKYEMENNVINVSNDDDDDDDDDDAIANINNITLLSTRSIFFYNPTYQ